jgi:hypothetical protein
MVTELDFNLVQRVALGDVFRRQARHIPDREAIVHSLKWFGRRKLLPRRP